MLESLTIKNYVLISELELDLSSQLTVLTGETGSGKSIILGAIALILGEKGDKDLVRLGAKQAELTATFSVEENSSLASFLAENEIEVEDGYILVRRIIKDNGRNVITIGDATVSRALLAQFGSLCVEVSSQHAHQALLKEAEQLKIVDRYADSLTLYNNYKESYLKYKNAESRLEEFQSLADKNKADEDYLSFCVKEIESVDPHLGEDDTLKAELDKISSSEVLCDSIEQAVANLQGRESEGALTSLAKAFSYVKKAYSKDDKLSEFVTRLETCQIELEDISETLQEYLRSFNFSPEELEAKNERLAQLQRIKKKYGLSLEIVLKRYEEMKGKLEDIVLFEDKQELLLKEVKLAKEEMLKNGKALTKLRQESALKLAKEIENNLKELSMSAAKFVIAVEPITPSLSGCDEIVFKIAANKGEKIGLITEVASGGELSRIMLAIKVALSIYDSKATIIFDEVDAGIGGTVALAVANMISRLSLTHQVLVITHLPQIACKADYHYLVSKKEVEGRTVSNIVQLRDEDRVKEIARLLSGDTSNISIEHARALLKV